MANYLVTITVFALCFIAACNSNSDAQQSDNSLKHADTAIVRGDTTAYLHALGMGPVKIGMTADQVEELNLKYEKKLINLDGDEYTVYYLTNPDGITVRTMMNHDGRVYSVITSSTTVTDEFGNGVGSGVRELENSYPNGRLIKGYAHEPYLRFLTATPLIFSLDLSRVPENCLEPNVECDFSLYSKVIEIEIGQYSPK